MPKKTQWRRAYWDWCRFNQIDFADWHHWMSDIVKSVDPAAKTHVKVLLMHVFNQAEIHFGVDPELMCEFTDLAGCDNFVGWEATLTSWQNMGFYYDLLNSFRNQPVFNSETHFITDGFPAVHVPWENSRERIWDGMLHHMAASTIWVWNEPGPGLQGSIYLRPANIYGVGKALVDANRLSRELAVINQAHARVALLYSMPSIFWDGGYGAAIMGIHSQLGAVGEKVTFVSERELAAGKLPDVDVIITSGACHVADATVDGLGKFVARGRRVVFAGEKDLKFDAYDRARTLPAELAKSSRLDVGGDLSKFVAGLSGAGVKLELLSSAKPQAVISGVEYRVVQDGDAKLVPLINLTGAAQTVRLPDSLNGEAVDLLSGRAVKVF